MTKYKELETEKVDDKFLLKIISELDEQFQFDTAEEVVQFLLENGKKGIYLQRYKGLGEMNPEQLWETTMDPEKRQMLQVSIDDAVEADEVFTVLMGDQVDVRREFIVNNALKVQNLDI